jgi:hypothetical protein
MLLRWRANETAWMTPCAAESVGGQCGDAYMIQQKSSRRVIDAHDTSDKDFVIVTRPNRLDSTQASIIKRAM